MVQKLDGKRLAMRTSSADPSRHGIYDIDTFHSMFLEFHRQFPRLLYNRGPSPIASVAQSEVGLFDLSSLVI